MIDKIYGKYFQKSKSFLYPALGIKKTGIFAPTGTYISMDDIITPDEMKLIVAYKENDSQGFKAFEEEMLKGNPLFSQVIYLRGYNLYVFDFEIYKQDWSSFLLGNYSKFSKKIKSAIKEFYGPSSAEYTYIETYLYPEEHYDSYAELLGVEVSVLREAGQLCDPCDLEKENLKIPSEDLENLKKVI